MKEQIIHFFEVCYPFGYPLLACSLVLGMAGVYHLWLNAGNMHSLVRLMRLWEKAEGGDASAKERFLAEIRIGRSVPARLCRLVAEHANETEENLRPFIETKAKEEFVILQGGIAALEAVISIAPMFGILGTAWGLVEIFGVFGLGEHQEGIAQGIATALYTTIFGLAIAAPGVILVSWFNRRLEKCAASLETLLNGLLPRRSKLN